MNAKHIIPFVVTAACALGVAPAASAATEVQQAASANWSGYVVGGSSSSKSFSSVSGGWTEPTASCDSSSGSSYSAFWVGLGGSEGNQSQDVSTSSGSSSRTSLEQAGTEADCSSDGTAQYFAWYELVPAAPVHLNLAIKPGDKMYTRVSVANQQTTVQLTDKTTGQSVTKTLSSPNPDTSSAEWIAEAPSSCDGSGNCQPLTLTDFGSVKFTNAYATANGHTGSISDPNWSAAAVQLSPDASAGGIGAVDVSYGGNSAGANPSGLYTDGSSFSVSYTNSSSVDTSTGGSPYGDSGSGGYSYPGGGSDGYGYPGDGSGGYAYVYPGGGGYSYGYGYPGGGYSYYSYSY